MSHPLRLDGELHVLGAHPLASNLAVVAEVEAADGTREAVIYKPVAGERPLWDFPDGSLAAREVAAFVVSELAGFGLVPPTVLRDGPLGLGAVQQWVGEVPQTASSPVALTPPDAVPDGYLPVLHGEGEGGQPLVLSHPDHPRLRSLAVLDAVLNNSDRKGSHVLWWEEEVWGIDHGVSLHTDPKLRTVLWGWAGEELPAADLERLAQLEEALAGPGAHELGGLITPAEVAALSERVADLLRTRRHPTPSGEWPSVPWPPM